MLAIRMSGLMKHSRPLSRASFKQTQRTFSHMSVLCHSRSNQDRREYLLEAPQVHSGFKKPENNVTKAGGVQKQASTFQKKIDTIQQMLSEQKQKSKEQENKQEQKITKLQNEVDKQKQKVDAIYVSLNLPLHKAVLLKQVAKELGIYRHKHLDRKPVKVPALLEGHSHKWEDVGLSSKSDMDWVCNEWANVMDARNIVAHTITADSAWQAFQYLTGEEERVYGLLFKKFFGWDMAQWESVSKEQKEKTLENYPEEHLYLSEF